MKRIAAIALALSTALHAAEPLWKESFEKQITGWDVRKSGGVDADATSDAAANSSAKFSSRSALAPNVWLSFSAKNGFTVKSGEEYVLRFLAKGQGAGRAFAALIFEPGGGESRFYLPEGTFDWLPLSHTFQVPPEAQRAHVLFGIEAKTDALWVDDLAVSLPLTPRTNLKANWQPRPHNRVFPQASKPSDTLVALDITKLDHDEVMLATTLQGVINRKQPRIYLYQNERDRFWSKLLVEKGYIKSLKESPSLESLLSDFRDEIPGAVIYDPALPASLNAAVMLGSLEGAPATGAETAAKYHLPIKTDLRGRWKRNVDAYRELWTQHHAEFASHVLAVHHPAMTQQGPRDYLAQQKIFTFWVSGQGDNEPGAAPAEELDFANEVLAQTPPNIPIMGWWSFGDSQGIPEYDAVRLCSSYAKFLAGSEFCTNLSVLSGIAVGPFKQRPTPPAPANPDKLYAALSVLDSGDSQWYWQHYQPKMWEDPARGRVAINWSLNPTVADVMPPVLAWFYETATPKDLFFCGLSGLGYMNTRVYASRYCAEDREKVWQGYLDELHRYMELLDLHILETYAGSWGEKRGDIASVYRRLFARMPSLQGILSDFGRHEDTTPANAIEMIDGKPVFHTLMRWLTWTKQDQLDSQLGKEQHSIDFTRDEFLKYAPTARPATMSGLILSWTLSPTLTEKVTRGLPPDVEIINADEMIDIQRKIAR